MNILLLLALLLYIGISAFLGYRRGIMWNSLRLALLALCGLIAFFFARGFAEFLIIKYLGNDSGSVNDIVTVLLKDAELSDFAPILTPPVTGILLSFSVPAAFSVLFVFGIIISLLIYLIVKCIIKKCSGKKSLRIYGLRSKLLSLILSIFAALLIFALLISPVYLPLKTINESGKMSELANLAKDITDLAEDDSIAHRQTINKINSFQNLAFSIVKSPAIKLLDVTFASDFSMLLYRSLSAIDHASITGDFSGASKETSPEPENYSFLELWEDFAPRLSDTHDFVTALCSYELTDYRTIDAFDEISDDFCEMYILSEADKLWLISYVTDKVNDKISLIPFDTYIPRLPEYTSIAEFKKDLHHFLEILKVLTKYF